jgi:RNAse (barnase) inhibitor barstar
MKTLRIDGTTVHDISSFYDEVNRVFMVGVDWQLGASLDALDDMLSGGYGALEGAAPATIVLGDDARLREALGVEETRRYLLGKLARPDVFNAAIFEKRLRELDAGTGPTYYDTVREILAEHPNLEVVED